MRIRNWIILPTIFAFIACSSSEEKAPPEKSQAKETKTVVKQKGVEWSYTGAFGPKFWGDLDPSFNLCKEGNHQSPINLIYKAPAKPNPFVPMFVKSEASVLDTGNGIHIAVKGANSIKMRNSIYSLQHIEFHAPSEHQFSGKSFPAEMQFYHKNEKGFVAVVSVMLKEGDALGVMDAVVKNLPPAKNSEQEIDGKLDLIQFLPKTRTLYNYAGSLTSPPCREGVNWIVLNTPVEVSKEQLDAIVTRYPASNRPLQPLNDRVMVNYAD
tara:strand:- start:3013 stop:3816 length:804 start_codon:yes stop_codon:yes gene_type:complete